MPEVTEVIFFVPDRAKQVAGFVGSICQQAVEQAGSTTSHYFGQTGAVRNAGKAVLGNERAKIQTAKFGCSSRLARSALERETLPKLEALDIQIEDALAHVETAPVTTLLQQSKEIVGRVDPPMVPEPRQEAP